MTCIASTICTSCISTHTLPLNQTIGQCIACKSPCATCSGDPSYCLTCLAGYTKKFWKCDNNTFVKFTLVLSGADVNTSQVLLNIDALIVSLLISIGEDIANIDVVTITTVVSASVVVSGSVAPSSGDTSTALAAMSASLSNGTIAGYTVTSSSLTTEETVGGSSSGLSTESIIGLAAGAVGFVSTNRLI